MSKREPARFFNPQVYGSTLKEVAVDYLEVENQQITSRWYKSEHDTDLYLWIDEKERIIKQQMNVLGRVVEWNMLDGIKTGVIVETEMETGKPESSDEIRFDSRPEGWAVQIALQVLSHTLPFSKLESVIANFKSGRGIPDPKIKTLGWRRVMDSIKKYFSER